MKKTPVLSPAMAPDDDDAKYLHLVGDKRYALHGEIFMLVLLLGFSLFLVLLVALPCLKRSRDTESAGSHRRWCFMSRKRKPRRVDDGDEEASGGIGNVERE
ncbi:hypothetical protein Ddye_012777 [Dipteronia dyeriana]|uniref:Uncharacterized protein n=1 Tax=Dipteronia dyeriana TaxID=168575 RepID=A0AAD9X4Y3_9ROSI|nr:hypothetical protein Ddye_012777 [Dipteronia dyeriana]